MIYLFQKIAVSIIDFSLQDNFVTHFSWTPTKIKFFTVLLQEKRLQYHRFYYYLSKYSKINK